MLPQNIIPMSYLSIYINFIFLVRIYYQKDLCKAMSKLKCKAQKNEKIILKETSFGIDKPFALAQRGLPTPFDRTDFYTITKAVPETKEFLADLQELYLNSNQNQQDHSLVIACNPEYWNNLSQNDKVEVPEYSTEFQKVYRSNIQLLFLLKKNQKTAESTLVGENIKNFINKYQLVGENEDYFTEGMKQANGEATDTVLGGTFNDKMELPKDPIKFNQWGLIGYEDSSHLGGSYLMAQKIDLKWDKLLTQKIHWESIIGRKDREDNDTIFPQSWCPHSHIKSSRIKDEFGNPVTMARQSKPYFDEEPQPGKLERERGIFFCGYLRSAKLIVELSQNQCMNGDKLLNYFNALQGGILYVPNLVQLNTEIQVEGLGKRCLKKLSLNHAINWQNKFPTVKEPSPSKYLLYSRNQYMQQMSTADEPEEINTLLPPTQRTLRLLTKTFALWQDTWYHDRRQQELKDLKYYLSKAHIRNHIPKIQGLDLDGDYEKIPVQYRQALSVYVSLANVLTSDEYGCRGLNSEGQYGAQTYHVEPEDLLAGGQANLTFGQGKHLIHYLTEKQLEDVWYSGACLSEHSGVGHIVPHLDEIFTDGLQAMIDKFRALGASKTGKVQHLFYGSYISLCGLQKYFLNYADLCDRRIEACSQYEEYSKECLGNLACNLRHISKHAPKTLVQGAQLALSVFISLHITGQPVSIGRLDQFLGKFMPQDLTKIRDQDQQVIDHFWIKVGEKANFNKASFEDHQVWGNLAMGGNSSPYPQGASFNQWGHQLTIGGTKRDGTPAYNAVTLMCIRASRRIPVNAPCLGLRVTKDIPRIFLEEAARAILSGGAHPILLNDDRVIPAIVKSGAYKIDKYEWDNMDLKDKNVDFSRWDPTVKIEDARDYSSDGCHQFLITGKCWFCLSGLPALTPLQLILNEGQDLLTSGTRYIHGKRTHFIDYKIEDLQKGTYEEFEDKYFILFKTLISKNFTGQLRGYGGVSSVYPTTLLNAFTAGFTDRQADFYSNGVTYNQFCPQFTAISNAVNALWNLKKYVFTTKELTLNHVRQMLLNNWGQTLTEPFVPEHLPNVSKAQLIASCKFWRMRIKASEEKFGLNTEVTEFGTRIAKRIAQITMEIFSNPNQNTLNMMKTLTSDFSSEKRKFGIQVMPGCGTFENYEDAGCDLGPSFDGRLRGQTIAEDFSPQPYLMDQMPSNKTYEFKDILSRIKDPDFSSGSVLDFNIDEDMNEEYLISCLQDFAKVSGPNIITVTTCDRSNMQELKLVSNKDLLRFRMGGWSQFGAAMFPKLLDQHIRRIRVVGPKIQPK